ncbi:ABC transporter permease subunit [Paracoccus cavernae]|uniref:ABC transporter permease subunit n=1 Tax=Paracoccus cavernae TaxID=1571207 RepID=A0ABT8DC42_9RHOB|nr:ABC transporter permease subunit [Paracoccus cavernae]
MSVSVATFAMLAGLAVSVPAALIIVRRSFRGRGALVQLLMSPLTVPAIVIGAALYVTVVEIEIASGLPLVGSTGIFVAGHVLLTIPWCIRLLLSSLEGVNMSIEEAAASLGAGPSSVVWLVTLPLIRPGSLRPRFSRSSSASAILKCRSFCRHRGRSLCRSP